MSSSSQSSFQVSDSDNGSLHDESNVIPSCGNARGVVTKDKRKDGSNKRQPDDVCEGIGDAVIDETKARRKKAKLRSPSERSAKYAELATTSSKGMRMSVKDRPERRKEKAAKNKLAFEHATKPTKSRPKMLKLSPENGGNIILPKDADVGQLPSNKPASKKPGRSMSNASQAVHVDINRTQVLRNNFGLSDAEILAFSGSAMNVELFSADKDMAARRPSPVGNSGGNSFVPGNAMEEAFLSESVNIVGDGLDPANGLEEAHPSESSVGVVFPSDDNVVDGFCSTTRLEEACSNVGGGQEGSHDLADRANSCPTADSHSVLEEVLVPGMDAYVDIVDMSKHTFLGYHFILRVVDPVRRYGFAVVLRNASDVELCTGFERLLSIMRIFPRTIYYSDKASFVSQLRGKHPSINFIEQCHCPLMRVERSLFKKQLRKWIDAYNNNWVRGTVIVQAIVNSMPLA